MQQGGGAMLKKNKLNKNKPKQTDKKSGFQGEPLKNHSRGVQVSQKQASPQKESSKM